MAFGSFSALAMAAAAAACSSTPPGPKESAGPDGGAAATVTADGGAKEAAGPAVLANGCPENSGYAGDTMCMPPPGPTEGFQLHYGQSGEYTDPNVKQPFVLGPGQEINDCYYLKTSNTTDQYVGGFDFQMRPGSHHIIMNVNPMGQDDGFSACGPNDMTPGLLYSSETPTYDLRTDPAPENAGLAVKVPASSQAVINFHVINTSSKPVLREAWLNYFYIDPSQVKGIRGNVFLLGGLGFQITPGTQKTYQYSCSPQRPTRILSLAAHMHAHTNRLSMWKVSGGVATQIYESYSWENPAGYSFDSVHTNPTWDRSSQTRGRRLGPDRPSAHRLAAVGVRRRQHEQRHPDVPQRGLHGRDVRRRGHDGARGRPDEPLRLHVHAQLSRRIRGFIGGRVLREADDRLSENSVSRGKR
ncbi:MAG: hypothetical protein ACRENE_00905 [Polyangiaceae bacterium]